jgi:hypothetical protein
MGREANISLMSFRTILPWRMAAFRPDDGMGVLARFRKLKRRCLLPQMAMHHQLTNAPTNPARGANEQNVVGRRAPGPGDFIRK